MPLYFPRLCPAASASISLACWWPLHPAVEQGHRRPKVVRVHRGEVVEGGLQGKGRGSQSVLLAFTDSPRIAKFFSNLQLLDVGANHQRGSPRAYLPSHPALCFPTTRHPLHQLPLRSAVSSRPLHLFMCLFIISMAASESERRHLVVRTVINSLKLLPLASSLHLHWIRPLPPAQTWPSCHPSVALQSL